MIGKHIKALRSRRRLLFVWRKRSIRRNHI